MFDAFRPSSQQSTKVKPSQVTLTVENGGGVTGEASRTAATLTSFGFTVSGTGNAAAATTTTVHYGTGAQDQADLVASYVSGGGAQVTADSSLAAGSVQLVLGSDFTGISHGSSSTSSGSHRFDHRRRIQLVELPVDQHHHHGAAGRSAGRQPPARHQVLRS